MGLFFSCLVVVAAACLAAQEMDHMSCPRCGSEHILHADPSIITDTMMCNDCDNIW
jgi:hypothetical protein